MFLSLSYKSLHSLSITDILLEEMHQGNCKLIRVQHMILYSIWSRSINVSEENEPDDETHLPYKEAVKSVITWTLVLVWPQCSGYSRVDLKASFLLILPGFSKDVEARLSQILQWNLSFNGTCHLKACAMLDVIPFLFCLTSFSCHVLSRRGMGSEIPHCQAGFE